VDLPKSDCRMSEWTSGCGPLFGHPFFRPSWIKHSPVVASSRVYVLHVSNQPVKSSIYTYSVYTCLCTLTCFKPTDERLRNLVCSSNRYKPQEATFVTSNFRDFRAPLWCETFVLLGCHAAYICCYRRFGTCPIFMGFLNMGQIGCHETSAAINPWWITWPRTKTHFLASYNQYCQHGGDAKLQQTQQQRPRRLFLKSTPKKKIWWNSQF